MKNDINGTEIKWGKFRWNSGTLYRTVVFKLQGKNLVLKGYIEEVFFNSSPRWLELDEFYLSQWSLDFKMYPQKYSEMPFDIDEFWLELL